MKKILSAVLALVMVAATFTMLVPNAFAATEKQVEAKVLYEEDFNDLNGKTPAEILAGANMTDERVGTPEYLSVKDGMLHYGKASYVNQEDAYVLIKDEDALLGGYTIEYEMTFLRADASDDAFSFHSMDTTDYTVREGRIGWVSQIRWNRAALSGLEKGQYKDWSGDGKIDTADQGWVQVNARNSAFDGYTNLQYVTVAVKGVFDATNKIVKTYMQDITNAAKVEWAESHLAAQSPSLAGYEELLSNDLRLIVYGGVSVEMDNLTVTSADGTFTKTWNFDNVQATTAAAMMTEFGWTSSRDPEVDDLAMAIKDGKIIFGVTERSEQEEFILVDDEAAKDGFVVEYDAVITKWGYVNRGEGFGFHSALATGTSQNPSRFGWVSQIRGNTNVLCGVQTGTNSWKQINNGTTANMSTVVGEAANMDGIHIAVRAVFDPTNKIVKTYAQRYTGEALTWSEENLVQSSQDLTAYTNAEYNTRYVRLIIYADFEMAIDNIKITALEKMPNVYGYQVNSEDISEIRLLGVIDSDVFTKAEKVGFRVTMTKAGGASATKDIDCNYVYSSITAWDSEPTTAADMFAGASHIYALHIQGITESVTINVTPYYVDAEGVIYLGDAASTIEYAYAD